MSKIDLRIRNNNKLYSIVLNDYRIGGCKWNDIEHGKCIEFPVNKEDVFVALGVDKTIANLQSQLDQANERLKDVIVPKFKIGQEIYSVGYLDIQSWVVDRIELGIINGELCEIYRLGHIGTDDYNCCILPQDNEKFFATLEEAEKKLQELRGGE